MIAALKSQAKSLVVVVVVVVVVSSRTLLPSLSPDDVDFPGSPPGSFPVVQGSWGCQLPHDWRPQTESCRAELAEIIVFAKVLALHKETYTRHGPAVRAEIELQCDQAWGSMLEMPAGSRFNVSGLGYLPCFSYSVTENNSYYFFLR
ncbi:hypothetical protein WMY93_011653 [Mugilogobius chulae]|uniref:Uncharacterized protein n=1 Tax=Mugilogobius chulae TaxID=88201 RepID=A0AAW0PC43_9GOBI